MGIPEDVAKKIAGDGPDETDMMNEGGFDSGDFGSFEEEESQQSQDQALKFISQAIGYLER
jgi:hypothetical protein